MALLKQYPAFFCVFLGVCLWLGVGCEPEATEGLYPDQVVDVSDMGGGEETPDGQAVVDFSDMNGTWVQARDTSTCVTVFVPFETRSYTLTRVEIEQKGQILLETHEVCSVETTPVVGIQTIIPSAVIESANPIQVESVLYGTEPGASYVGGPILSIWGMDLEDPQSDLLPEEEDDPRVVDADEDGSPGVTLKAGGDFCDLHVLQRDFSQMHGTLQEDGSIEGPTTALIQQVILGATSDFCGQDFETRPNPSESTGKMIRVDERGIDLDTNGDGSVSCEEIIAAQSRIISWREPDEGRCGREE